MDEQTKDILRKHGVIKKHTEDGENKTPVKEVFIDMDGDPLKKIFEMKNNINAVAVEALKKMMDNSFIGILSDPSFIDRLKKVLEEKARELEELKKYLDIELKKPIYEGKDIDTLFEEAEKDENGEPVESSLFMRALQAAEATMAYEETKKSEKHNLRTIARAGDDVNQISITRLATPTENEFRNAITLLEQGNAYLNQVKTDGLEFENGKLYFKDQRARSVSEVELKDLKTKENIESINLPFLQFYYTLLFSKWEQAILDKAQGGKGEIKPITKFYLPDLAKVRGLSANTSKESVKAIINDISAFHNVVGVLKVEGFKEPSYYPVLNFEGYDVSTNTVSISSPYLLHVVDAVYSKSIKRGKDKQPLLRNDGKPQQIPVNSYLVHSSIQKERNKAAVQNVILIVQGIERRGGKRGEKNTYTIKAKTLIDRNPILKHQLDNNSNKSRFLQRVFTRTWILLKTKTDLMDVYENMQLPDEENPKDIPTYKQLDNFIITITHEGKKEKDADKKED